MVKLRIFQINLDNAQGIFWPGQTVSGRLTVDLESEMKMREMRLAFVGMAHVHWTESEDSGDEQRTVDYTATEYYFNNVISVFGKGTTGETRCGIRCLGGVSIPCQLVTPAMSPLSLSGPGGRDEHILHPGQHVFPFSFVLPPSLPSSFEGNIGHVRYTITGTIDRPWRFDDHTVLAFTVLSALDLNQQPQAINGEEATDSKNLCCLCCESGPITGTLKVRRTGYVPGESIYFEASTQNMSSRVCGVSVALEMAITYHATSKSRTDLKRVNAIYHQDLEPGESDAWGGDRFVVPPLPPSYLTGCRIIDIRYILRLIINPSGPAFNLVVPVQIIIGTIPLQSAVQQYQQTVSSALPSAPPEVTMPAPSYNESILGPTNIRGEEDGEHTQGQLDFTPTYTYYNWSKTT